MEQNETLFAQHLARMIQFATISKEDPAEMDMTEYEGLLDYLNEAYPLIRKTLHQERVGKAGIIYRWSGSGKSRRLPLLLIAHTDVVPAGDLSAWTHSPFSGDLADGCVWGRGTLDCKCFIQSYMDAIELLLQQGFQPECDIYLAFGYNEEIMGGPAPAAALLAEHFQKQGIQFGCVLDEGGGLFKMGPSAYAANIMIGEKGYADFEFSVEDPGGHSSKPKTHTALGLLAQAACEIEANPFPQRLTDAVSEQLQAMAKNGWDVPAAYRQPAEHWPALAAAMEADPALNALTRTTVAITMASGSAQANVLPQRAAMVANIRLLPGDTLEDATAHFQGILPQRVQIKLLKGSNPPPVQRANTDAYQVLERTYRSQFPNICCTPCLACCGTDSRFYCGVCPTDSVYRVCGMCVDMSLWSCIHSANERVPISALSEGVEFYKSLIEEYATAN